MANITDLDLSREKESINLKSISPLEKQLMKILEGGPMTRDQMVKRTGIPRTTIYDGLKKLIMRNEVKKYPLYLSERKRGRPKIMFQLTEE